MRKIIKVGKQHKYYKATCSCNCEFAFETQDIYGMYTDTAYIICPDCNDHIYVFEQNKIKSMTQAEFEEI